MAMTPKLVVIGYTNIDVNITPNSQTILPGGAAYFVACAASLVTSDVGLVTRVGHDFDPTFLLSRVKKEGVHIIKDKETAKSIQTYHSDDPTDRDVELKQGVAQDLNPHDIPEGWIEGAEIIHVGTMPPQYQSLFLKYVKAHKRPDTLLSSDVELSFVKRNELKPQIIENIHAADLMFVNRTEYELLSDELKSVPEVIMKKDKEGACYFQKGRKIHDIGTRSVVAVDATGAGDVFAGVFLGNRVNGRSIEDSLNAASMIATRSIEKEGIGHLFE